MEDYGVMWTDWLCEDVRKMVRGFIMPPRPCPPSPAYGLFVRVQCRGCGLDERFNWRPEFYRDPCCFCIYCPNCDWMLPRILNECRCQTCNTRSCCCGVPAFDPSVHRSTVASVIYPAPFLWPK
jgi:hypothetical protein